MAQQRAAQNDAGKIGLDNERPAERLHYQPRVHRAAAETAFSLGERQTQQTQLGEGGPDIAAPSVRLRAETLARLEAVGVGDQSIHAVLEQALVVAEVEVHGRSPVVCLLNRKLTGSGPGASPDQVANDRWALQAGLDLVGAVGDRTTGRAHVLAGACGRIAGGQDRRKRCKRQRHDDGADGGRTTH